MADILWNENSPADGDSLGLGDDEIRSLKTSIRAGLGTEHVWPSTGGPAGVHLLGSARPFYGTQSIVSSTGTDGRLMLTSDTSRLFGVGSGGTLFLGGPTVISAGTFPGITPPQRYHWVMEFGTDITGSNGSVSVSIPNSGYSGIPRVWAAPSEAGNQFTGIMVIVEQKTASSFRVSSYTGNGQGSPGRTFDWFSLGTRVL